MLEQDRLISTGGSPEDEAFDRAIRPRLLKEFVGQATVKKQMDIFIRAARNREQAMDHVLIFGCDEVDIIFIKKRI